MNQQCRACHTLEKGGAQTTGPNLHGVFGRKAGTAEGFAFSEAMVKSGIVWDDKTMAEYNRDPKAKVPGTKMVFNGVKQQGQLDDLWPISSRQRSRIVRGWQRLRRSG